MSQKETIQQIAIADLKASPTNPRKYFDKTELQELADSITANGVQQPIIARLLSPGHFQIVAGERRWRASKLAGKSAIPAIVRELSDTEAEQQQMIENLQRADLSPMEEAHGYDTLRKQELDIAAIAAKVGKRPALVAERLQLLQLPEAGRKALDEGRILLGVAFLIARIPTAALREQAVKTVATSRTEEFGPMGLMQARGEIERRFMLQLARAPFDRTDGELVPAAGTCAACPKRTGNQQTLFADVKSPDICLDPVCYQKKVTAHQAEIIKTAKADGRPVLQGDAAKKAQPNGWSEISGYVELDKERWIKGKSTTLRAALGKSLPPITVFESPHDKTIKELITRKDAAPYLQEERSQRANGSSSQAAERKKQKIEMAARLEIYRQLMEKHQREKFKSIEIMEMRMIATSFFGELNFDKRKAVALRWAAPYDKAKGSVMDHAQKAIEKLEAMIPKMNAQEIGRALIDCTLSGDLCGWGDSGELDVMAKAMNVDAKKIRATMNAQAAQKPAKKAKTAGAAK